jgi:hypothetical protein
MTKLQLQLAFIAGYESAQKGLPLESSIAKYVNTIPKRTRRFHKKPKYAITLQEHLETTISR